MELRFAGIKKYKFLESNSKGVIRKILKLGIIKKLDTVSYNLPSR
jgi:hypothetical protein